MSDPVSNVEDVEDVLSSIRRLVSETSGDARPKAEDETQDAAQDAPAPQVSDALILTSALRIKEPQPSEPVATDLESLRKAVSGAFDDASEDDAPSQDNQHLHLAAFPDQEDMSGEADNVAKWPSNPPDDYYEDEADGITDAIPFPTEDASEKWAVEEDETSSEADHDVAEAPIEEPWINVGGYEVAEGATDEAEHKDEDHNDLAVEMTEALSEDDQTAEQDDPAQDDGGDDVAEAAHDHQDDPDEMSDENMSVEDVTDDELSMATFIRSGAEDHADEHVDDDADAENSDVEDAHVEDAAETEDHSDQETMFAADEDEDDQEPIDLSDLEEAVIDEDMLRDLVAEIVRQELTGAMGERITRNVRKLVRREIHRAMASREFD